MLITRPDQLGCQPSDLVALPPTRRALMGDPRDFDVTYSINPHMMDEEGQLKQVDQELARKQWQDLKAAIEGAGLEVLVLPPLDDHPDLVFCANPCLVVPAEAHAGEKPISLVSHMACESRAAEPEHVATFLEQQGFEIRRLKGPAERFEGTGDGIWHPGRRLLWGGVGSGTSRSAWEEISTMLDLPIALIELVDPDFYHLDTCLAGPDETHCLWFPPAFTHQGKELIEAFFPDAIAVAEAEARRGFVCNAWCPDGRHVFMQSGNGQAAAAIRSAGFELVELETSEFRKSGGSVFCMKHAL